MRILMPLALAVSGLTAAGLRAQSPGVELTGELPPVLRESSGVAVSRRNHGVLWTHNDSGNDPVLFAVDITGRILGAITLESTTVRDWEDVGLGPCVQDDAEFCIYVADTGDNMRLRSAYTIYIVPEPDVSPGIGVDTATLGSVRRIDFHYPDAPHDVDRCVSSRHWFLGFPLWEGRVKDPAPDCFAYYEAFAGGRRIGPETQPNHGACVKAHGACGASGDHVEPLRHYISLFRPEMLQSESLGDEQFADLLCYGICRSAKGVGDRLWKWLKSRPHGACPTSDDQHRDADDCYGRQPQPW